MSDTTRTVRSRIAGLFDRIDPRSRRIRVDVEDHDDEFVVRADLPGYERRDLDVTAYRDGIRVVANGTWERSEPEYSTRERTHGRRERLVELPAEIDERDVTGTFVNGVLVVRASKRWQGGEREEPMREAEGEQRAEDEGGQRAEAFESAPEEEPEMGPSDEEVREYETKADRQLERQRDFQRDKSGQPYRRN